ncbi:hypothetical protein FRB97_006236 [Tulasnella sp. 331]|nr:hypothetical protein FRB97_006236 [Tulasnella sp. 331]
MGKLSSVNIHSATRKANPDAIPTLTYTQKKKPATFVRPGEDHIVAKAGETTPVKSGDVIYITGRNLNITFTWVPVNILIRSGISRDERNALTSSLSLLGIKSSFRVGNPFITHVVFSTIPPPPFTDLKILVPLASGVHFVTPGWLAHIIKRGTLDPDVASGSLLAEYKDGLDEEKFRPDGAGLMAWSPDEKRKALFKGVKFHFVTTTDTPADLLNLLTTASGGSLTTHTISASSEEADKEWDSKLDASKRKADKHIKKPSDLPPGLDSPFVLIGNTEALWRELGDARWEGVYKAGMESLGVRMIWIPEIADALLKMDLSYISSAVADEQSASTPSLVLVPAPPEVEVEVEVGVEEPPLPAFIPSTHPSEPSIKPFVQNQSGDSVEAGDGTKKRLVRRVTGSTTPATENGGIQEIGVRRSTRRGASVAPPAPAPVVPEPPVVVDDDYALLEEVPRTVLKRRVTRRAASKEPSIAPILPTPITHIVYPSALGTYPGESSASIPDYDDDSILAIFPPPPVRALKRRVTGRQKNGGTQSMDVDDDSDGTGSISQSMHVVGQQPPHKKYKALFEGTQQPLESVAEEGGAEESGKWGNTSRVKRRAAPNTMDIDAGENLTQRCGKIREGGAELDSVGQSHVTGSRSGETPVSALRSQVPPSMEDGTGIGSGPSSHERSQPETETIPTQPRKPTQGKTKPTVIKKVHLDIPSQNGDNEDSQHQTAAAAAAMTVDPQLQLLLQSKSKKTSATAGLDKEFTNLRLTAHPAERLKLEEEERLRRDLEVWKELQQKEKNAGGSMDGNGSGQRGNFMVVVLKDDLIVNREDRRSRTRAPAEAYNDGAVPNFKKFRKKNVAALRGPRIELELPPPVDYGMGDAYWQNNHAGDATIGGDNSNNPLAASYSQANGGESSNGHRLNLPTIAQPRQKKHLQLPRVHSSDDDEPEVKPAVTTKGGKAKGKAKAPQKKFNLHFSDLEDEDNDAPPPPKSKPTTRGGGRAAMEVEPEDESEIFDLNVSGVDEEDDDFGSTAGRTIRSSARSTQKSSKLTSNNQSQRSTRTGATVGGTANGKKRKAGGMDFIAEDDEEDQLDDDSDDGAFKGFGKKRKTAVKKAKR